MAASRHKRVGKHNGRLPLVALLILGTLVVGGYLHSLFSAARHHPSPGSFASLVDHKGRLFAEQAQSRKFKLVTFGYTHCADVCPTMLLKVREVLIALGPDSQRVVPLFITVDPVHDTADVLAGYTAAFDPRVLGITGPKEALRAFAISYGVVPADKTTADHEAMPAHSAMIYLLGPDNTMLERYAPTIKARAIASDVLSRTNRMAAAAVARGGRT